MDRRQAAHSGWSCAAPNVFIAAAACSRTKCVAVGGYRNSAGLGRGLILTGWGRSWTAAVAPRPAGTQAVDFDLNAVACNSVNECVIGGFYTTSSGSGAGLLLTGWGRSWHAVTAPVPAGARPGATVASVACPLARTCVAGGTYSTTTNLQRGMLVTGWGKSWTVTKFPPPKISVTPKSMSKSPAHRALEHVRQRSNTPTAAIRASTGWPSAGADPGQRSACLFRLARPRTAAVQFSRLPALRRPNALLLVGIAIQPDNLAASC
jgi:hypothetical protein